eukprot:768537-Hanusia_phi.AAC.1
MKDHLSAETPQERQALHPLPVIRISAVLKAKPTNSPRASTSRRPRPPVENRRTKQPISSPRVYSEATSPRLSPTRLANLSCRKVYDYNALIHEDAFHRFSKDMFGQMVYKQDCPDLKPTVSRPPIPAQNSPRKMIGSQTERNRSASYGRRAMLQVTYFSSDYSPVKQQSEARSHKIDRESRDVESSKYANKELSMMVSTPRQIDELCLPKTPRMHAYASGILPPYSIADGKDKRERYLSHQQRYPLRVQQTHHAPRRNTPAQAQISRREERSIVAESEEENYPDFEKPFDVPSFEFSRKAFKKLIEDKIFWGRYEPDGHGSFKLRSKPKMLRIHSEPPEQLATTRERDLHRSDANSRGEGYAANPVKYSLQGRKASVRLWLTVLVHSNICMKFEYLIDALQQVELLPAFKLFATSDTYDMQTYHPSAAVIQRAYRYRRRLRRIHEQIGKV